MKFPLHNYAGDGDVLVTRDRGARARHDLERLLDSATIGPDDPVAIDFSGILAVDVPFIDEFLGPLLSGRLAGFYENHPILAVGVNEGVRETLDLALRRRHLHLLGGTRNRVELLGGDELLELTLRAAMAAGRFSASDLARDLKITPQAMNNRLKTLLRSGALRRTRAARARGGKEFEYEVPDVDDAGPDVAAPDNGGRGARRHSAPS